MAVEVDEHQLLHYFRIDAVEELPYLIPPYRLPCRIPPDEPLVVAQRQANTFPEGPRIRGLRTEPADP